MWDATCCESSCVFSCDVLSTSEPQLISSLLVRLQPLPVNHTDRPNSDSVTEAAIKKSRPPSPSFGSLLIKRSTGAIYSCPFQSNIQRYCQHLQQHQKLLPKVSTIESEIACPSVTARVSFCRGWDKKKEQKIKAESKDEDVRRKSSIDFTIRLIWLRVAGREVKKIRMRNSGSVRGDKETLFLKRCVYHLI